MGLYVKNINFDGRFKGNFPQLPDPNFIAAPTSGASTSTLTVQFTDTSTGSPTSWLWDFKNDGTATSTQKNPSYTYTTPGTYSVKLTVTNAAGSKAVTKTNLISYTPPPPVANFTGTPLSGTGTLTVSFTDTTTNFPSSWAWDFTNDGVTDSTVKNPTYTYANPGTYSVKLTASNVSGSNSVTKTNYITVASPSITTGLQAWFDAGQSSSYPGSGNMWYDISGNGRHATLYNQSYNSSNGGSIVFNGGNTYGTFSAFDLSNLTICAWIYKTGNVPWASIVCRYGNEDFDAMSFGFDRNSGTALTFAFNNGRPWGNQVNDGTPTNNEWNYVCVTATPTEARFYINGVLTSINAVSAVSNFNNTFYIGANFPGLDEYYAGRLAVLQMYDTTLSAADILQNYNATRARFGR